MEHQTTNQNGNSNSLNPPQNQGSFLPVVYEDSDLLILNKSSGIHSVPLSPSESGTAVHSALAHFPNLQQLASLSRRPVEPGLLHRLDALTSGLLVFAKKPPEFERLLALWKNRRVRKIYRCLAVRSHAASAPILKLPHTISYPIARISKSTKRMKMLNRPNIKGIRGKPLSAITHLRKLHGEFQFRKQRISLLDLEVEIETGVMHQIRCHLSGIGLPILGDPVYGEPVASNFPLPQRLWLHAFRLDIPLVDHKLLTVESQLPDQWPSN